VVERANGDSDATNKGDASGSFQGNNVNSLSVTRRSILCRNKGKPSQ
jgi:hypothetical protein